MFCMIRTFSKDKFFEKVPQCSVKCSALRPSGVCKKKVCQLNLRRRRENTRKYANPLSSRESRDEAPGPWEGVKYWGGTHSVSPKIC